MKTIRYLFCISYFIGLTPSVKAQIEFETISGGYVSLESYLGIETSESFNRIRLGYKGMQVYYPNWSVIVRLLQPITPKWGNNVSGLPFPAEKISFRFTTDDNQEINLNSIAANRNPIYLKPSESIYMIQNAQYPIQVAHNDYKYANLNFTFRVDGGKYLDDYKNTNIYTLIQYDIPLLFTLYDGQGRVLATFNKTYTLAIQPKLRDGELVDVEPDFSISVLSDANIVNLLFRTQQDYQEGVSTRLNDALKINAKTGYEVRLKALSPEFLGTEGQTMELSTVGVQLMPGNGARPITQNPFLKFSTNEQIALVGQGDSQKKPQYFHMDYKAALTREQLRLVKPGSYSVSLMYLLIPR